MQKRITSLLLIAVLLLSLLAGCQSQPAVTQTEPSHTEAPTVVTTLPATEPTDPTGSTEPTAPTDPTDPADPTEQSGVLCFHSR